VVILVAAALLVAGAMWQEEVMGLITLQAWDRETPKRTVADFIRLAHSEANASLAPLLSETQFDVEKEKDGRVKAIKWISQDGLQSKAPRDTVPGGEPKEFHVVMRKRGDQHFYSVVVQFGNGKWGVFRVDRAKGKAQIGGLPPVLDDSRPQDLTHY